MDSLWKSDVVQFARLLRGLQLYLNDFCNFKDFTKEALNVAEEKAEELWKRIDSVCDLADNRADRFLRAGGGWYDPEVCALGYLEFKGWSFTDLIKEVLRLRDTNRSLNELCDNYCAQVDNADMRVPGYLERLEKKLDQVKQVVEGLAATSSTTPEIREMISAIKKHFEWREANLEEEEKL